MSNLWTAIIAAGAAILASALTSYLTHYFARRQHQRESELKWLEERFSPALVFLGKLIAAISNLGITFDTRHQILEEIQNLVAGASPDNNAWCIAVLLDPENTGLRDHILSAMAYARVEESAQEFNNYWAQLSLNLEALAGEYRRERHAIAAGKSLESLITQRKAQADRSINRFREALEAVKAFLYEKEPIQPTLTRIERSGIRGTTLQIILRPIEGESAERLAKLDELSEECQRRGFFS